MTSWLRTLALLAAVAVASLLGGCGHSGGSSGATLRVINATKATAVTVSANGAQLFASVAPGSASSFVGVGSGTQTYSVASVTGASNSYSANLNLTGGQNYTLLAYESQGSIRGMLFVENQATPVAGYGTLNVSNVSSDPGPLDVYVVPAGGSITGIAPTFPNTTGTTMATTLAAGSYDVVATAAGNPSDLRFTLAGVPVASTQVQTLALTGSVGGMLVNGVLFTQAGSVQFAPTPYSRVRVVSALPTSAGAAVVGTVGTQTLAPVYAPNPGVYTLVPGATTTYSISVNGAAVGTLPAANFATGSDYTILVYGSASTPAVAVFTDDNHQAVGGQTNLRLVNGAVNVAGGLTLYNNNVTVATSIGYGAASGYVGTIASGSSVLQLVQPGVAPVSATVQLLSGGVYTVFVLDPTLTPYVVKDR